MPTHKLVAKSEPGQKNVTVLLIDNAEHEKKVRGLLESHGVKVCLVHDDSTALEAVRTIHPDLIIGNWDDENIDLGSIVNKLRNRRASLLTVPTMLMTAMRIDASIAFALNNAGFDVIVQKPLDEKKLAPLVIKTARKRRSWRRSSVSFQMQGDALAASASGCLFKGI